MSCKRNAFMMLIHADQVCVEPITGLSLLLNYMVPKVFESWREVGGGGGGGGGAATFKALKLKSVDDYFK